MFIKCDKKEWGKGIPIYNQDDLMTKEEIYDFALDVICNYESKNNKILQVSPNYTSLPSIVMDIDGQLSFVLVEGDVAPNTPKLQPQTKIMMLNHAKKFNANAYYASVCFGSKDSHRFEKSLALKGDGYYCRYLGLEKIY